MPEHAARPCNICDQHFTTTGNLEDHMLTQHGAATPHICNYSDYIADSHSDLANHNLYNHRERLPYQPCLETIPQFDGPHDSIDKDITEDVIVPATSQVSASATQYVLYQLNQRKQVDQLTRDTRIADFDIVANDSNRNVNIPFLKDFTRLLPNLPSPLSLQASLIPYLVSPSAVP